MQTFRTKKETLEYLDSLDTLVSVLDGATYIPKGIYYLAHGEHAKPTYTPRRYKDGWGIRVDYNYYYGTFNAPKSGRVDI